MPDFSPGWVAEQLHFGIVFLNTPGREAAKQTLQECIGLFHRPEGTAVSEKGNLVSFHNQTWVTRKEIFVDRIASGWLIERFIDQNARFKFVTSENYSPKADEVRFDMFEAEFTHQGVKCTFEVLVETFALVSIAVTAIAEIIHDMDLKDNKYGRPEMVGVQALFSGMV